MSRNWAGDYKKLAAIVILSIKTLQAKMAVEMMVDTSILKLEDGKYYFGDKHINGDNIASFHKKKARREVFENVVHSLDGMSPDVRFATYSTFSTDRETYEKINKLYMKFKEQCSDLITHSNSHDDVYQMVFGNIPVSRNTPKQKDSHV